ncbi:acetylornithine deacetylase [Marinilactibacillus sp. 15R]|uniref:M20/M25/M40 family metallo-hydrolase n=1 Tax=Marinilactibacillus sp. 15R TaxID=1911586 RepID=UPI00090C7DAD|nr:M20/M25/M40 family metallo-hydrolase [Marinilactibacillus sp. 15R]API90157.1 acetylornithine deacetylase [Marinilactibacillus sp. 15R]
MKEIPKTKFKETAEQNQKQFFDYLRLESVSTQGRMISETAEFVKSLIEEFGGKAELLNDLGGHPIVYGFFEAGQKGNAEKTLLFYNHYDVQPEDPLDEWKTTPFEPTIIDEILYCRGVSDNKANFMARLNAIQLLNESEEGLPCKVKFLVEGEEEIGSPNIDLYLEKYADLFEADACIWESGSKDSEERFTIDAGIKGIAYFDAWVESADVDIHSSKGAVVDNAAWRLTHALSSLRTKDHQVTIDGFYEMMKPPTELERSFVEKIPFNADKLKENYGLKNPLIVEKMDRTPQEALILYPTLTISGLLSGYIGPGSKTVLPRKAQAKIDVRLVPGMDPNDVYKVIRKHWDKNGFNDVQLKLLTGEKSFRTDLSDPFVDIVLNSAKKVYGEDVVLNPNSPGTGPMHGFGKYLKVPILGSGTGWAKSGAHAPNENVRLKDFYQGIEHMVTLLSNFGS